MTSKKNITLIFATFGLATFVACSPDRQNSTTKELVTDLGEPDGTFYYKLDGENLTRAKCLDGQSTVSLCTEGRQSVNYKRFQLAFVEQTAMATAEERNAVYDLLKSPVAFRPMMNNNLTPELRPLITKLSASFLESQKGEQLVSIYSGETHSCALNREGKAFCWGTNSSGELGNGNFEHGFEATAVIGDLSFSKLFLGSSYTCGLTTEGKAYCWGYNSYGELGVGDFWNKNQPTAVAGDLFFSSMYINKHGTCGLTETGKAYCWGKEDGLRLGIKLPGYKFSVPQAVSGNHTFSSFYLGRSHSCGIDEAGITFCWGYNRAFGYLGYRFSEEPTRVNRGGIDFSSLTLGDGFTCGIDKNGKAYCWGRSGHFSNGWTQTEPVLVNSSDKFIEIKIADRNVCGLTSESKAFCWSTYNFSSQPDRIMGDHSISSVNNWLLYNCGITTDKQGFCWGTNSYGQLGTGDTERRREPVEILGNHRWESLISTHVWFDEYQTCGLVEGGVVYCWGAFRFKTQSGDYETIKILRPSRLQGVVTW